MIILITMTELMMIMIVVTWMTSRVLMVSMGIITVTLAAAATAPSTNDTWRMKRQT